MSFNGSKEISFHKSVYIRYAQRHKFAYLISDLDYRLMTSLQDLNPFKSPDAFFGFSFYSLVVVVVLIHIMVYEYSIG